MNEPNRCWKCGPEDERRAGCLCDACFDIAWEICLADRRRFQKLLSAGVSREMANRIMIDRNEGGPPS